MATADVTEGSAVKLGEHLGIKENMLPAVFIV